MNKQEFLQVAEWIADGVCEYNYANQGEWIADDDGMHLIIGKEFSKYRRKPQPKYRPWKAEEVPVLSLIRVRSKPESISVILAVVAGELSGEVILDKPLLSRSHYISDLLSYHGCCNDRNEVSHDHGKTWLPCGVLE